MEDIGMEEGEVGVVTHEIVISNNSETIVDARELAEIIHSNANRLLERLLSHLSQLPELPPTSSEDGYSHKQGMGQNTINNGESKGNDEYEAMILQRGLTLPASAVAWLADQLNFLDRRESQTGVGNNEYEIGSNCCGYDVEPWLGTEGAKSMRYRLSLLRSLLPRVQLIRLTRQSWPPQSPSNSSDGVSFLCTTWSRKQQLKEWWRKGQRRSSSSSQESEDTAQIPTEAIASEFLGYAKRFEHGASKYVNLRRAFPNAAVLILESVPPSWIDMDGGDPERSQNYSQQAPRLISVTNAAIYDMGDFLSPTLLSTPSITPKSQTQLSNSLTHLKLDNCSLGELTTGFAFSLGQLVHLEILSLRQNQFRSAKSLLGGLRPLIRLRYLDLSANRLVGCFGPHANLCLGGQVRTLKLSDNFLTTCQNSGLEKCYALRELWLDSNCIEDVAEVSGLAQLPDLQCLSLQRNPFSSKTFSASPSKSNPPSTSPALTNSGDIAEVSEYESNEYDNPFYDPNWKIRLWTWFQHERQALTPLELPVMNKKTKNMGFDREGCDAAMIGRMTREQWDRIQEESYSIATTASMPSMTSSSSTSSVRTGAQTAEEGQLVVEESLLRTEELSVTETPASMLTMDGKALNIPFRSPVRNPRVTKKSKTRRAKIHSPDTKGSMNRTRNHGRTRGGGQKERNGETSSSDPRTKDMHRALDQDTSSSPLTDTAGSREPSAGIDEHNASSFATSTSCDTMGLKISSENKLPQLSFSLQDVFVSLKQESEPSIIYSIHGESKDERDDEGMREIHIEKSSSSENVIRKSTANNDVPSNPFLEDDIWQDEVATNDIDVEETNADNSTVQNPEQDTGRLDIKGDVEREESTISQPNPLPIELGETDEKEQEFDNIDYTEKPKTTAEASNAGSVISNSLSSPKQSPRTSPRRSPRRAKLNSEDRIFVRPKVSSIKLKRMGNSKPFDALTLDWNDLIKRASEGRIPDGLTYDSQINDDVFSDNVTDLLANNNDESTNRIGAKKTSASGSRSTSEQKMDASVPPNNRPANALPEHVWQDDNSVLSSLGASRDEVIPRETNKFQLAEENCTYDGPESARGMKVVENLQLYFEKFVFHTSVPNVPADVLEEIEEDQGDWQLIAMYYPRIQLWPDDRRLLESERGRISSLMNNSDWTTNRELFLRVWNEDVVPCGRPALRRLPPNRRNRLGFHGDKLFENSDVDAYAECRKVLLCLSSKAFYVIPEEDDVTTGHQQQAKKRIFPLPLSRDDRFRDAPWPHAVARHCLGDLEAICIGFEFQRLILRFRNPSLPRSDPFVYVLLTGDKRASVRILQEIQKLAKDFHENNAVSNIGSSPVADDNNSSSILIENDSHIVMDSLHSLVEKFDNLGQEQGIGTIMHFQIVQQHWKHGDRGTVRRVCVVTDTMILLLDEDYAADGHDISSITVKGKHMADARYRLVDQAALSLVSQVEPAGRDPRAITIMIKPSTLSRTHRWRLICRDREGAERLVEDARKALETL